MVISYVLLALNVTYQMSAHASSLFKLHWKLSTHMILSHVFLMAIWSVESSVNKWMSFSRCEANSSIKIRKSTGPRILLWGTPADTGFTDDVKPPRTIYCCLSGRKEAIQQCKWMPKDESFSTRPLCHTRSNTFLMSRAVISCWVSRYFENL